MKPFNFNLIVENHSLKNLREIKAVSGTDREYIIKSVDNKLQAYFDKLVPTSGNSQFLEGEMLRAINRIIYRSYNDGDYFYQGYGAQTVGPAMAFLTNHREIPIEIRRQIIDIEREAVGSVDKNYEDYLYQIAEIILDYLNSKNGECTPSTADLFDYDSEYDSSEEDDEDDDPGFDYDDDEDEEDEDDMYESISEALTPKQEKYKDYYLKFLKENKKNFIKLYGPVAERVMYGRAIEMAKLKSEETLQEIKPVAADAFLSAKEVIKLIGKQGEASIGDTFTYGGVEMQVQLTPNGSLIAVSQTDPNKSIPIIFGEDPEKQKVREMVKNVLRNPELADRNRDGELSSWEKKVGAAIEKNTTQNEIRVVSPYEPEDDDESSQGDWGSSDQAIMNRSIHRDLNEPIEFPGLTQTLSAVEEAVDFYWDDWEEYQTEEGRENLIRDAFQRYMGRYFPDFFRDMQAFMTPIDEDNTNMMKNYTNEDLDLGHEDNEPHMIKGELYRIGKYAMELYQMVDEFEYGYGEVDFPAWWQAMITDSASKMVKAKHYLDFETKEPEIDAMVGAIDMSGALDNVGVDEALPPGYFKKKYPKKLKEESPLTPGLGEGIGDAFTNLKKMIKILVSKDQYLIPPDVSDNFFDKLDKATDSKSLEDLAKVVNKSIAGGGKPGTNVGSGGTGVTETRKLKEESPKDKTGLRYALATNLAKTGKPQTQSGAKPAKLTPGLEKKREANVKKLKKYIKETIISQSLKNKK